jgi:hypothetical protein
MNTKNRLLSKSSVRVGLGIILVALIAGVYFLFKPFPAGPSLNAEANVRESGAQEASALSKPASKPSLVQKLDIGGGYVLENSSQGSRIIAPSVGVPAPVSKPSGVQRLDIGGGYVLESSAQGSRIIAPERFVPPARTQRLDIGGGYVLENSAQGSRIIAPSSSQNVRKDETLTTQSSKIDIGGGYMLVLTKDNWTMVPAR